MRPGPFFLSDVLLPGLDSALSASALCLSFWAGHALGCLTTSREQALYQF